MLALTAQGMNAVNSVILGRMQSEIPLIPALAGHLISGGGKRLRPMLTLAGAELVGLLAVIDARVNQNAQHGLLLTARSDLVSTSIVSSCMRMLDMRTS